MSRVVVQPRAQADLDEIWTYVAERNRPAADSLSDRIVEKCEMLGRQPMIGESAGHISPALRRVVEGNYVIYYEIEADVVYIRRVLHGARDISQFFGPQD